jgi:hypothetical protein
MFRLLLVMRAVADAERELGLKIEPQRFVFETLQQLSAPAPVRLPVETETAGAASPAPAGLMSRILGRFGRGP